MTIWVKKDDGTTVAAGTKDYDFTVSKEIIGKRILMEGVDSVILVSDKKVVKKEYQKHFQFAVTGIKIIF